MSDIQQPPPLPEYDVGEVVAVGLELAGIFPAGDPGVDLLDEITPPGRLDDGAVPPGGVLHLRKVLLKIGDHPEEVRAEDQVVAVLKRIVIDAEPVLVDDIDVLAPLLAQVLLEVGDIPEREIHSSDLPDDL